MIKFDKLKLKSDLTPIININEDKFIKVMKDEMVHYLKFSQKKPYQLSIIIDYTHQSILVEFTGKILLEEYHKLISKDTIQTCIHNLNALGLIELDVELFIEDAEVLKCDVTTDVLISIDDVVNYFNLNIRNHKKWVMKQYKTGITIENVVKTPKYKKRLSVYNKEEEIRREINKPFLQSLSCNIMSYFKGMTRFELNLNTMSIIRNLLGLKDNKLTSIVNTASNPILKVIDEIIEGQVPTVESLTLRDYERTLLLRECDYDFTMLESKIRSMVSKKTSVCRLLEKYRSLASNKFPRVKDIRQLLASLLYIPLPLFLLSL